MSTTITTAYYILEENIQTEVIHPYVNDLPGLLLYSSLEMFLPSTVSSTKNKHGLNVAQMLKV